MNEKQSRLKLLFGIFSIIASVLLLVFSILAFAILGDIFGNIEIVTLLCVIGTVIVFIFSFLLDRNENLGSFFQHGKYNYRWFFIYLVSSSFNITFFFIYLVQTDFNSDLGAPVNLNFLIFLGGSLLLNLTDYLIYFGIKNIRSSQIHKVKFSIFSATSSSLLTILIIGLIIIYNLFIIYPAPNISQGSGYNEGPWLTWYNNKPNQSICITWLTSEKNDSIVYYGENPSNLNQKATGTGSFVHKVYIDNLKPKTKYYYFIPEDFSQIHKCNIFSFTTASSYQESFKLGIFGDMQPDNQEMINQGKMVVEAISEKDLDFVIQLGDIADSGSDLEDWHKALGNVATIGSSMPFQAVIGNHDWSAGLGSSNWNDLFTYNYENPAVGRYYSFDYHNAHFVIIDNFEHYYTMTNTQLDWIKEDLTKAKAQGQDWIFCAFHLSMMTTSTSGMMYDLQETLVPIFDEYGVDAVFFAHDHDYQHYQYTYGSDGLLYDPSHNWEHNEVHYFCSGGGGANLEVSYGVLEEERMLRTDTVRWWDENFNDFREIQYERNTWNEKNYITHDDFEVNYSHYKDGHSGKYYYQLSGEQCNHEFAEEIGFQYGEQCYHYIEIDIDGSECIISVKYPNGVLLSGPNNNYPQQWRLTK